MLMRQGRKEREVNKIRRKELQIISNQIEELRSSLEDLCAEEEEYRDNMPENLWGSERYDKAEEAITNMEDAISALEDAISSIDAAAE